jgi:hypothetical protein
VLRPIKTATQAEQITACSDRDHHLHDTRLPQQHRQKLAAQISHAQGNRYLQRALARTSPKRIDNYISTASFVQRAPEINAIEGTTDELKSELVRLQQERDGLMASCIPVGHRGGQNCPSEVGQYNRLIKKLNTYIAERGNSALPDASIELMFDGKTLDVVGKESASFTAVSGKPDPSGTFTYTPERQRLSDKGPIPEGIYWIDPKQLKSLWYYFGDAAAAWGSHRITIHPFHSTATFGRGGFFIHGGSTPGSAGCIDLTGHMSSLVEIISRFEGDKIKVHVRYPHTLDPNMGDFPTPDTHYG